ncbi:MAG: sulfite exporter TauE/SafE family protein [Magnetococcales bacterium]|nr:sulfite exporter TauE/SafE family protein [Magnetococcales bacterium]
MEVSTFITLDPSQLGFLFIVGFIGGMVSGFIGSGGAFVLTPAMMSLGAPGIVAVASNICHKFPKALVGAMKRDKYGMVDWKLGLVLGVSAEVGMLYGAHVQEKIKAAFGDAGSNLYVSVAFVLVLAVVGSFVLLDAIKSSRLYHSQGDVAEKPGRLALWIRSLEIPGTMIHFPKSNARISFLVTIPIGLATGMLAATIAVGGFIGVPAMIYLLGVPSLLASGTELVVAFVMGLGGTIKFGWSGFVDVRMAMIILAGSLFGIQLGAIGATYVKPYLVKMVMGVIMIIVLFSRMLVVPVYLAQLDMISLSAPTAQLLKSLSFNSMIFALLVGAGMILNAIWRGMREDNQHLDANPSTAH